MENFDFNTLKTGDLLFLNYESSGIFGWFTKLIKWGTHSNYSHIAMILKDPCFNDTPPLKGLYVWESSYEGKPDPQDNKIKLGVQVTPLQVILDAYKDKGSVFVRQLKTNIDNNGQLFFTNNQINTIHNVVYDKPYDIVPMDWINAFFKKDNQPQKTSRFWCAALVGYIYTMVGILDKDTDWSILTPNDFSLSGENLKYADISLLKNEIIKIQ